MEVARAAPPSPSSSSSRSPVSPPISLDHTTFPLRPQVPPKGLASEASSSATGRAPPPRTSSHPSEKRFNILRKSKGPNRDDGGRYGPPGPMPNGHSTSAAGATPSDHASGSLPRPEMATLAPEGKPQRTSRSRSLAKKTSRLFLRDRDRDKADKGTEGTSPSDSLASTMPNGSRQTSFTSTSTTDTRSTASSSRNPFAILQKSSSNQNSKRSPRSSHSRRRSEDSEASWQNPASVRSIDSRERPQDLLPNPQRQGSSLSASVPTLPRGGSSQSATRAAHNDTLPSRMSTWFSQLLPSSSAQAGPPTSGSSDAPPSPARKPPSAASTFFNAARQKAVDGVRHLLDSEAMPDKCQDTIWLMGIGHPGWRPSTPDRSQLSLAGPDDDIKRRSSETSSIASPARKDDRLRPANWKKTDIPMPSPIKKPPEGVLASPTVNSSPDRLLDTLPQASDSPSKLRGWRKDKEAITWPEDCEIGFGGDFSDSFG